ncbi:SEC23-interacting protein [Hypsibius exemplaris]|uniref:SEC23-interacting protein n=1 Tax=Hypsibius exemplaris TaxID=2072580 RepID=A0A1W0WMV4_HYPEX|nr:SEC23-interacting protein [Hypsibius exemplaris]
MLNDGGGLANSSDMGEEGSSTSGQSILRQQSKIVRRSSSMLDLMKYSMARANEIPAKETHRKPEEAWKTGRSDIISEHQQTKRIAAASSIENDGSKPGQDFKQSGRTSLRTPTYSEQTYMRRSRHDTDPCSSLSDPIYMAAPNTLSRSNTWFSSLSDYSSSMDYQSSFDSVDGLFSRNGPMVLPFEPVHSHWFFCRQENGKDVWIPFTHYDSKSLEEAFHQNRRGDHSINIISTQGGRYDVDLKERKLTAVYWEEEKFPVRRGTWFSKMAGEVFVPYEEQIADKLEGEYRLICKTGDWQKRIDLPGGETIILHSENAMIHYDATKSWTDVAETLYKNQKTVKRGWEGTCMPDEGEWEPIDHVVFVSHGIGSYCDLKWRTLNQCVDAFRLMSRNLLRDHFNFAGKKGKSFRVEFIPINWHGILHSDNTELENRIKRITLPTIPIVRYFANDYVLDILFYSSPKYCKIIADHVASDMNRLHALFLQRNPGYKGGLSIIGHSLGSIVLFDMLSHQPDPSVKSPSKRSKNCVDAGFVTQPAEVAFENELGGSGSQEGLSPRTSYSRQGSGSGSFVSADYVVPPFMGAGYPSIRYPVLSFKPSAFFAIGSPVGMFLAVRGVTQIAEDYSLPTCPKFLNIFHPTDPVAYRIEPLLIPEACKLPAAVIENHKSRQRLHLVQKNLATVASSLKSRLLDPVRALASFAGIPNFASLAGLPSKVRAQFLNEEQPGVNVTPQTEEEPPNDPELGPAAPTPSGSRQNGEIPKIKVFGQLNGGDRIDYVLQQGPLESLNQYLFALHSHAVYWDSEDCLLFILRQIIDIERDNLSASMEESEEDESQYI